MVLLIFVLIGILFGLFRDGHFPNIACSNVKGLFLPIVALLMEKFLPVFLSAINMQQAWITAFPVVIEYSLLGLFVALNLRQGLWSVWFGIGTLLNFAVIAANDWCMPVWAGILNSGINSTLVQSLTNGEIACYVLANENTRLLFLGDIIGIRFFSTLLGFASIGDYILGIGVAGLAFRLLCPRKSGKRSR